LSDKNVDLVLESIKYDFQRYWFFDFIGF